MTAKVLLFIRCACCAFSLLFASQAASAHATGVSRGEYRATDVGLDVDIVFAERELASAFADLDSNHDGAIGAVELAIANPRISTELLGAIEVSTGDSRCNPELLGTALTERDGLRVRARYRCPVRAGAIHVTWSLLDGLPHGHRHLAHVISGTAESERVYFGDQRHFDVAREGGSAAQTFVASEWLALGVHHILTGYDHLVFLFALVLVAQNIRSLITTISCFTLAHSITLAAAALGVVAAPEHVVEPAIALSIAYVGVENFWLQQRLRLQHRNSRALLVFAFGLVHGFGFAGALSAVEMPKAELPLALVLFNLGVELGQIAVIAAVFPLIRKLRQQPWFAPRLVPACSAAIVLLGLGWFVQRVTSG